MQLLASVSMIGNVLAVILIFNLMIFVHELGHFLAAKWRGLHVDRFQIWFGKPILKKTWGGVQYGLGWIPAGGFVSLPQMASMESVEGETQVGEQPLPAAKPLDKIIVAFAGPLFSLLLAFAFALVVSKTGVPETRMEPVVGWVMPGFPAAEAGILPGDRILKVNGHPVSSFAGQMKGVTEQIMLTEGDKVHFEIERDGKVLQIQSPYTQLDTEWYERRSLPKVGIFPLMPAVIERVHENSPAALAGLSKGDRILQVNGHKVWSYIAVVIAAETGEPLKLLVEKENHTQVELILQPVLPQAATKDMKPMLGIAAWDPREAFVEQMTYPSPMEQVGTSLSWMKTTVQKLFSSTSKVGVDQLSGPIGIGSTIFDLLASEQGMKMVLWFSVLLNVNLAVMNMLPLPILDGGHIVMSLLEMIRRKPLNPRILIAVQNSFALLLLSFMLYVSVKDIGGLATREGEVPEIRFEASAAPANAPAPQTR